MVECIWCSQCCIKAPCAIGRMRFRLKGTFPKCKALTQRPDSKYSCLLMEETDPWMRELMLGTGCRYPEYRQV